MRVKFLIASGIAASALLLFSQPPPNPPEFEVVSVKPADPKAGLIALFTYPGGRITVNQYTLEMLIEEAFDILPYQLSGGPNWIRSDRYDIEARPPASSKSSKANPPYRKAPPNEEQRRMLQTLLADRFQLKVHREVKDGAVYVLVRTGKSLKLNSSSDKDEFPWAGFLQTGPAGENISMPQFAKRLSGELGRPVLDRTGLGESFDFKVDYQPDERADRASLFISAIRALGLKLETSKGPVETIVIDRAEKPFEN